jgi:hypothetical protein
MVYQYLLDEYELEILGIQKKNGKKVLPITFVVFDLFDVYNLFWMSPRVSPNFRLKRKEAKRTRKN